MKHLLLSTCLTMALATVAYAPSASYAAATTSTQTVSQKTAADGLLNATWRSGEQGYKPIPLVYDAAMEKYDVDRITASLQGRPDAEVQKMLAQSMDYLRPARQKQIDGYTQGPSTGTAHQRAMAQGAAEALGFQVDETLAKISADAIKAGVNQATHDKIMQTAATEINLTILTQLLNNAGERNGTNYGNGRLLPTHAADALVKAEATKNTRTGTTGTVAKPYATRASLNGEAVAVVGFGKGTTVTVNGRTRAMMNNGLYIETNDSGGYRLFGGYVTANGTLLDENLLPATGAVREKLLADNAEYLSVLPAAKGAGTPTRTGFTLPATGSTTTLTVDSTGKLRDAEGNVVGTMRGAGPTSSSCPTPPPTYCPTPPPAAGAGATGSGAGAIRSSAPAAGVTRPSTPAAGAPRSNAPAARPYSASTGYLFTRYGQNRTSGNAQ